MRASSDHAPLLLETNGGEVGLRKPFRFELFWLKDPGCAEVVNRCWVTDARGSPAFRLCQCIKNMKKGLRAWNKNHFGCIQENIALLRKNLEWVQTQEASTEYCQLEHNLILALNEELQKEEELWRSKSRVTWLTTKDLNTKYFHTSTIIRRRRNAIEFLKMADGVWLSSREEIGDYITRYFQDLYRSTNPQIHEDLKGLISPILSEEENELLCRIPSAEQIKATISSMGSYKAPGSDGMTAVSSRNFGLRWGLMLLIWSSDSFNLDFFSVN